MSEVVGWVARGNGNKVISSSRFKLKLKMSLAKESRTGPGKGVVWGENKVFSIRLEVRISMKG